MTSATDFTQGIDTSTMQNLMQKGRSERAFAMQQAFTSLAALPSRLVQRVFSSSTTKPAAACQS